MKKLTAGIFATLLAVVSADGAYAAIASKGYVDEKVGTVTTELGNKADKTELGKYATTAALTSGLAGKLDTGGTAAKATADASGNVITTTYATKTELGAKANTADLGALATKDTVSATEIGADAVTTEKILDANVTKAKLASDVQTSLGKADSALQQADLADYAKTADVASTYETKENAASTYETKTNASATYETKTNAAATYATKEEIAGMATDANLAKKQDKNMGSSAANSIVTTDGSGNITASATIAASKVSGLGSLATKSSVATTDIASKAVTKEKLADDIVTSLGRADTALQQASLNGYLTKTAADAAYAGKTLETQVGTVSKENMGTTTATTVVAGVKEAIDAAKAAASAASTADGKAVAAQGAAEAAKTAADSKLPTATYNTQVGTVSATNMGTSASTVVTAIKEVAGEASAAQTTATAAQKTANAAIPAPTAACADSANKCVLVSSGAGNYSWEVIARGDAE